MTYVSYEAFYNYGKLINLRGLSCKGKNATFISEFFVGILHFQFTISPGDLDKALRQKRAKGQWIEELVSTTVIN